MGYRYHFYAVNKSIIKQIKTCRNIDELTILYKENNIMVDEDEYPDLYVLGKEIFDFGKFYKNIESIQESGTPLFNKTHPLHDYYEMNHPYICDRNAVKIAIESIREELIENYNDLLSEKSNDPYDTRSQLDRLKAHVAEHLSCLKYNKYNIDPYNLDDSKDCIVNSSMYEHQMFELARIYKTFDKANCDILFMGW